MAMQVIKGRVYVGNGMLHVAGVEEDSAENYTVKDNMIFLEGSMVSGNFSLAATQNPFFADDGLQEVDASFSPTASITYAGDSRELDETMFGLVSSGGAMLDNLGALPEITLFWSQRQANNQFVIIHIPRCTATKDSVDVSTKTDTTTFTPATATITPLKSNHFNTYFRRIYSTDPGVAGKSEAEVIAILRKDPGHVFTETQEA